MARDPRTALARAVTRATEADAALTEAMTAAREAGMSWAELAEATGLSVSACRWRLGALDEAGYVLKRRAAGEEAAEAAEARRVAETFERQTPAATGTTEVTIAEAARMLGVSRPTLYRWMREGRVPTTNRGDRRLVAVDPRTGRIAVAARGTHEPG